MGDESSEREWALGVMFFAGLLLLLVGIFQVLQGLAALIDPDFFAPPPHYAFAIDATAWGGVHLALGLLVMAAGVFLFFGTPAARFAGIAAAALSATSNFLFIPYFPVWAVLIIALDLLIIWALAVHGRVDAA